jgi:quercetin dioxygenase-like cupin family protein
MHAVTAGIVRVDEHDLPWFEYRTEAEGDAPAPVRVKALTREHPGAPPVQFVEYSPGHTDPVHHHDTGEVMVIVEGELWLDGTASGAGSVVYIARDVDYALRAGDAGARFFRIVVD